MRRRLVALGVGLALLLGAEGVARLFPDPSPPVRGIVLRSHPTRIWTLGEAPEEPGRPLNYRLTAEGNRRPAVLAPAGTPLVLTTGDSSIFGDGLRDGQTFHDVLQASLSARGVPARVETLAVPGHSTLQTRAALDEVGWSMAPTLLVVGNLWSDSNLDAFRDADLLAAVGGATGRAEGILVKSMFFRQLRRGLNQATGKPSSRKIAWPTPGAVGVRRVPIADYVANLEAIFDEAGRRGVGVVVLALANAPMVRDGLTSSQEWSPYVEAQAAVAAAHGVPRVDALVVYRQSGQGVRALFQDELHPSAAATRMLGEAAAGAILEAGWPAHAPMPRSSAPLTPPFDPFDGKGVLGEKSVQLDVLDG